MKNLGPVLAPISIGTSFYCASLLLTDAAPASPWVAAAYLTNSVYMAYRAGSVMLSVFDPTKPAQEVVEAAKAKMKAEEGSSYTILLILGYAISAMFFGYMIWVDRGMRGIGIFGAALLVAAEVSYWASRSDRKPGRSASSGG